MYNIWWLVIAFAVSLIGCSIAIFFVDCDYYAGWFIALIIGIIIGITGFATCLAVSIVNPLQAKKEYTEFIETQAMVEQVYNGDDYNQYENAGLNNKIIELNQWLASAKSDVKIYGNWSMYCTIDLNSLDYIKLVNTKDAQ